MTRPATCSLLLVLLFAFAVGIEAKVDENPHEKVEAAKSATKIPAESAAKSEDHGVFDRKSYQALLQVTRQEQAAVVQRILDNGDRKRVKSTVKEALTEMRRVLGDSKRVIEQAKFLAKSTLFPAEDPLREAVAKVVENTAFFFEFVVYLPDYAEHFYKKLEMKDLIDWAYEFATKMALYDDETYKMLTNGAQELEMIPRMPHYKNPYRYENIRAAQQEKAMEDFHKEQEARKKKEAQKKAEQKKAKKTGPKMTNTEL
ncbi:hypothetical protein M3Y99_01546000 [Aphelenchoides fujianensis]|nr:hypothetical protein M3Y99_01546000 [Aphelenchoides fujianensis]